MSGPSNPRRGSRVDMETVLPRFVTAHDARMEKSMAKRKAMFKKGDKVRHKSCVPEEIGTVLEADGDKVKTKWPSLRDPSTDPTSELVHADSVINVQPEAEAAFVALAKALGYEVKRVD